MKTYYFTFGFGQPLENCYTTIEAKSAEEARQAMVQFYGDRWSFQYNSAKEAGVKRWNLRYVPFKTPN